MMSWQLIGTSGNGNESEEQGHIAPGWCQMLMGRSDDPSSPTISPMLITDWFSVSVFSRLTFFSDQVHATRKTLSIFGTLFFILLSCCGFPIFFENCFLVSHFHTLNNERSFDRITQGSSFSRQKSRLVWLISWLGECEEHNALRHTVAFQHGKHWSERKGDSAQVGLPDKLFQLACIPCNW